MDKVELCEECVCAPVCSIFRATGGLARCVMFRSSQVEVKPIVHARWISRPGTLGDWHCSNCEGALLYEVESYGGGNYHDIKTVWSAYCPHCGAQMDEEELK